MWIDCWAESMRVPELEKVSRRLDLRWKDALSRGDHAGVKDGDFICDDPTGAAWRLIALIDGLAVQVTVHQRVISRRQLLPTGSASPPPANSASTRRPRLSLRAA